MSRVAFWRFLGGIFSQRCQSRDVISLSLSQFGTDANAAHSGSKRFLQASALEELKIRSARARRSIQTMPVPNARRESISRLFSLVSNTASFGLYLYLLGVRIQGVPCRLQPFDLPFDGLAPLPLHGRQFGVGQRRRGAQGGRLGLSCVELLL